LSAVVPDAGSGLQLENIGPISTSPSIMFWKNGKKAIYVLFSLYKYLVLDSAQFDLKNNVNIPILRPPLFTTARVAPTALQIFQTSTCTTRNLWK